MKNNIWNELSEESKKNILEEYASLLKRPTFSFTEELKTKDRINHLETLFGKENLKSAAPLINTWKELEKLYPQHKVWMDGFIAFSMDNKHIGDNKISNKLIATLKIAKLIESGYGGMVTNEEWLDDTTLKYCIVCIGTTLEEMESYDGKEFIAFHTREQRNEFFNNNKQLCKDYYMI